MKIVFTSLLLLGCFLVPFAQSSENIQTMIRNLKVEVPASITDVKLPNSLDGYTLEIFNHEPDFDGNLTCAAKIILRKGKKAIINGEEADNDGNFVEWKIKNGLIFLSAGWMECGGKIYNYLIDGTNIQGIMLKDEMQGRVNDPRSLRAAIILPIKKENSVIVGILIG